MKVHFKHVLFFKYPFCTRGLAINGRNMIVSPKIFIVRNESRELENFTISRNQDHDIMIKVRREGKILGKFKSSTILKSKIKKIEFKIRRKLKFTFLKNQDLKIPRTAKIPNAGDGY